jgi:diguanylate cyclase (GGDEF)-like protein
MKKAAAYIKGISDVQRSYFLECGREIAVRNLQLMRTVGIAGALLYLIYFVVTQIFFSPMAISPLYALIVPVLIVFVLYSNWALSRADADARYALRAAFFMYITLMAYMIVMSVFPHPDVPSAYFPLFLLMAPVLFIFPAWWHLITTFLSLAAFFALVIQYKSPDCWSHELFEATTSALFSVVVIVLMTQFRLQSDSLKRKYYELSRRDVLTGTLNKATGEEAVREYISDPGRRAHAALMLIDVDNFKSFNDRNGHLEGDRLLGRIGAALTALCRRDDIVCRFGGDEFMILLKDLEADAAAVQRARDIIEEVGRLRVAAQSPTLSVGICFLNYEQKDFEELIRRADAALYQAKRKGKNRYEVWMAGLTAQKAV